MLVQHVQRGQVLENVGTARLMWLSSSEYGISYAKYGVVEFSFRLSRWIETCN